jgi:peptidoglycan-N-acetylglucosamine deacetylase
VPRPALTLTFDDGPDPAWTRRVLEALEHARVTATFFVVGERVLAEQATARAVLAAGHEVQLHCHRHVRHTELSEGELRDDVRRALAALSELGVEPDRWRTPWGVTTAASVRVARAHRLELVGWTIDTHDWRGDPASAMLAVSEPRLGDGGVVLMHDALGPGARREGCAATVELLGGLLAAARARDLLVVPLRERAPDERAGPCEPARIGAPV